MKSARLILELGLAVTTLLQASYDGEAKSHRDKEVLELKGPVESVVYYQDGEYDKTIDFNVYGYSSVPGQSYEYNERGWPVKIIEKPDMVTGVINFLSFLAGEEVSEPHILATVYYDHEHGYTVETQIYQHSGDTLRLYRKTDNNEVEYWTYGITTFRNTILERDSFNNWTKRKVSVYVLGDCRKEWIETRKIEYYQLEDDGKDLTIRDIISKPLGKAEVDDDGLWSLSEDDVLNFIMAHRNWQGPGTPIGLWNNYRYDLEGHYGYRSRYNGVCPASIYYEKDRDDHSSICSWEYTFYFDMEGQKLKSSMAFRPKENERSEQEVIDYMNHLIADLNNEGITLTEIPAEGRNAIGEACRYCFKGSDKNADYVVKMLQLKNKENAYRKVILEMHKR
ncbi:MAG: hypothetical protein ACI3ZO_05460 [Candidatus Cryptobacteroides sp.]